MLGIRVNKYEAVKIDKMEGIRVHSRHFLSCIFATEYD